MMMFCCSAQNDLFRVLAGSGVRCLRFDDPAEAVEKATADSPALILADSYPDNPTRINGIVLDKAYKKNLRLYIEYPASAPGLEAGQPRRASWERAVVVDDAFGVDLPKLSILAVHGCWFVPVKFNNPMLAIARVAGFDKAVYGLPKESQPALFEVKDRNLLVATTKLSNFVTGRYAPAAAWKIIWKTILARLAPGIEFSLEWTPTVHPMYGPDDKLPASAENKACRMGARWFFESRLMPTREHYQDILSIHAGEKEVTAVSRSDDRIGDGSYGILEGFSSLIRHDGSQEQQRPLRTDCQGETAMALSVDWYVNCEPGSRDTARNLLDYTYFTSGMHSGPVRGNPEHPAFGLIAWMIGNRIWERAFYGDDNARVMLGTMVASACLGTDRYDEPLLRALLANLRTTGPLGFRGNRIDIPDIEANGWKHYHEAPTINPAPHFESYLWACNLWAYRQTGHKPFIENTKKAIRKTMELYPDGWRWANGIAQERARMILCLSWLVRLEDTQEHRDWLQKVAYDLLINQEPCGAIREQLGAGASWAGAPGSNESYGTEEAPLIQENGDPVADMLYTSNFAFLGLHEAVAATGDPKLRNAEDKLAKFLCRIQVSSREYPYLHGAWFRAFDYRRWDYFGSSADIGWGPWSIETGWTQSWITAILGLRAKDTSIWGLTSGIRIDKHFGKVQEDMSRNDGGPWTGKPW